MHNFLLVSLILFVFALSACSSDNKPTTAIFDIEGKISGLTGVVRLSANDNQLTTNRNGEFGFGSEFSVGDDFVVSVLKQPSG